jgi:hypothetical protein
MRRWSRVQAAHKTPSQIERIFSNALEQISQDERACGGIGKRNLQEEYESQPKQMRQERQVIEMRKAGEKSGSMHP